MITLYFGFHFIAILDTNLLDIRHGCVQAVEHVGDVSNGAVVRDVGRRRRKELELRMKKVNIINKS